MTDSVVETKYGEVKGEQDGEVFVWKGIPYAKPPVGELRFRAPQAPESWSGVYDATEYGPAAMQPTSEVMNFLGDGHTGMSEDRLYLNVWSPQADNKRRPVMVWIHGGAYLYGSGASDLYDGATFAMEGDVVVVTINYRLGSLGFLDLGNIGGEEYATSGNCGMLDQVAALKWVQENISAFGGDPNQVTIFGESAGAMSIGTLLAMPSAKGLFNQAILQSGAARNVVSSETSSKVTRGVLQGLGISENDWSKLKEVPAEILVKASEKVSPMALVPVVDGISLPEHPEQALVNGDSKDISILIGTNKDEYRLFTYFDPTWDQLDEEGIKSRFEQTFVDKWAVIFSKIRGRELTSELFAELMTLYTFTQPAKQLAEIQADLGAPVYMYRFDWETPVFDGGLKASHALELPFVWNKIDQPGMVGLIGDSPDQRIATHMHQAWIAFAKTGHPNVDGFENWPAYDKANRATMVFNTTSKVVNNSATEGRLV